MKWSTQQRRVDQLKGMAINPRKLDKAGRERLLRSLRKFDLVDIPVVNADDTIISGHQRVAMLLAEDRGAELIDVRVPDRMLDEAEVKEYMLQANTHAGKWDEAVLQDQFADVDLTALDDDVATIINDKPRATFTDPDDVPEPPAVPVSALGDVWLLGEHRLMCGDSTDAEMVQHLLAGAKPHLMVTDPPYGVDYDPKWRDQLDELSLARGAVKNDDRADWSAAYEHFTGTVAYVWHAGNRAHEVAQSLLSSGFKIRAQIIWVKPHFVISRGHYHGQHEPCWYAVRNNATGQWRGDRKQSTVWEIANALFQGKAKQDDADKDKTGHGTQKPVECMKRPIENNSRPGDGIYEPFSGSGTTIIAAEMTGRKCMAMEITPIYVDVAVQRWQKFTGKAAVLEGDGRSFNELSTARAGAHR